MDEEENLGCQGRDECLNGEDVVMKEVVSHRGCAELSGCLLKFGAFSAKPLSQPETHGSAGLLNPMATVNLVDGDTAGSGREVAAGRVG